MKHSAGIGSRGGRQTAARGLAAGVSTVLWFGVASAAQDGAEQSETRLEEIIVSVISA